MTVSPTEQPAPSTTIATCPGTRCRSTSDGTVTRATYLTLPRSRPPRYAPARCTPAPDALDRGREPGRRAGPGPSPAPPRARRARRRRPRPRDRALGRRRRPRGPRPRRVRSRARGRRLRGRRHGVRARRVSPPTTERRARHRAAWARATTSPASSTSPAATSTPPSTCCAPATSSRPTSGACTPPTARRRGSRPSPTPASTRSRTSGRTRSRGPAARRSTCSPRCARWRRTRPRRVRVTVDGATVETDAWLVAVGNTRTYASGMMITPAASVHDGLLDVCVVGPVSRIDFLRTFPSVFSGTHVEHPEVRTWRGVDVTVEALDARALRSSCGPAASTRDRCPHALEPVAGALAVVVPHRRARDYLTVSVPSMPWARCPVMRAVEGVLPRLQVDLLRLRCRRRRRPRAGSPGRRRRTRSRGSRSWPSA